MPTRRWANTRPTATGGQFGGGSGSASAEEGLVRATGSYHLFTRDTSDFSNYTTGAYGDDTVSGDYDVQSDATTLLEYTFEGEGHAEGEGGSGGGPSSPSIGGHFTSDAWTIAEANGQSHYHASDIGSFDEEGSAGAVEIDYTDNYTATHESGQTTTATDTNYLAEFTMTAAAFDDELVVYGKDGTYEADGTSAARICSPSKATRTSATARRTT